MHRSSPLRSPSTVGLLDRRRRSGESAMGAVGGLFLAVILAVSYIAWAWFPTYWDWMAVKEISTTVVRDWTNHENLDKAKARFESELRRKDVSTDITPDVCKFIDRKGAYELECSWTSYAYYPGTSYYKAWDCWVKSNFDGAEGEITGG